MKLIIKDLPIDESEQHHNDRTNLKYNLIIKKGASVIVLHRVFHDVARLRSE